MLSNAQAPHPDLLEQLTSTEEESNYGCQDRCKARCESRRTQGQAPDRYAASHGNGSADSHGLNKKQANEILAELVEMITKNLKKGARLRLAGLGMLQVRKRPARMGRTRQRAKPSRSRPARRLPSALPRNSRKPSKPADLLFQTAGPRFAAPPFSFQDRSTAGVLRSGERGHLRTRMTRKPKLKLRFVSVAPSR